MIMIRLLFVFSCMFWLKFIPIQLQGFAIGNGLTNPAIQYQEYSQFAFDNKMITKDDQADINKLIPDCEVAIKTCGTRFVLLFYHTHFH